MRYGVVLPRGDARDAAELAREAEDAGWDGFFVWEPVWGFDAWMLLTAAAMVTERVRLGTLISPLPRMRPWDLAGKTVTLDHLSNGRVILSVGLGAIDTGLAAFGEAVDRRVRAELLDEGLDILTGLWQGRPMRYHGTHYRIEPTPFPPPPPPVQQPRIPIWVIGAWPHARSMRRALRYDGIIPTVIDANGARQATIEEVRAIAVHIAAEQLVGTAFDIVVEGETPGMDPARAATITGEWAEAGATWWIEAHWSATDLSTVRDRVRQGPPHPV